MEKEYKMSAARAEELREELNYLKTTRSDEVAEMIKVARGFGDLSENSEYDEAKNEQGKLYSRIAELEVILQHVVIIDEAATPSNVVAIGSLVTVVNAQGKEMDSDLNCHLRVGNDSENLLRIYFLHDDEQRLIVIGSLPDHLRSVKIQ